jgi:hypothetical protein
MPVFSINYNESVPGVVSMPRANMNVDTGAGVLAEATSRLGETLANAGFKIQQAQNAMELSTLQRKSSEIHMASLTALQGVDPKDDDAIAKIKQKRDMDLSALKSKSMAVNDTLKMHINQEMPRFDAQFQGDVIQRKAKAVKDDFDLNAQTYLADGNQTAYLKLLHNAQATDVISPVEFDYRAKAMPNDSLLAQAEKMIGNKDGTGALDRLAQTKDMNPEQVQRHHQLEIWAKQTSKVNSDQAKDQAIQLMNKIDQLGDFNPLERGKAANKIITMLHDGGVTGDDYLQWAGPKGVLAQWQEGTNKGINYDTLSSLALKIDDVQSGNENPELKNEINQARAEGAFGSGKTGATRYDQMMKQLTSKVSQIHALAIRNATQGMKSELDDVTGPTATVVAKIGKAPYEYHFRQILTQQVNDHPEWDGEQIYIQGEKLKALMKDWTPSEFAIAGQVEAATKAEKKTPHVANDEDYAALKSGDVFIDPTGKQRRKP